MTLGVGIGFGIAIAIGIDHKVVNIFPKHIFEFPDFDSDPDTDSESEALLLSTGRRNGLAF